MPAPRPDARVLACAALLAGLGLACEPEPGAPFVCSCTFVTDFDADSKIEVEVCGPPAAEVVADQAKGCAQSSAPGPVQTCDCRPVGDLYACKVGTCRAIER